MALEASAGSVLAPEPERAETAVLARVLARVIAGVVHDVRTPLGTMMMKMQLLRDAIAGEAPAALPEPIAGHLRVLDAQVERITEMLRRVASALDPPSPLGWVDLSTLLADVAGALGYEAKLRTLELVVEPRAAAVKTSAEPANAGRILLCLVARTIAASRPGSRVVARAVSHPGAAVVELDHTPGDPEPAMGYDWTALAAAAAAVGGALERAPAGPELERLTLTLPGNDRT